MDESSPFGRSFIFNRIRNVRKNGETVKRVSMTDETRQANTRPRSRRPTKQPNRQPDKQTSRYERQIDAKTQVAGWDEPCHGASYMCARLWRACCMVRWVNEVRWDDLQRSTRYAANGWKQKVSIDNFSLLWHDLVPCVVAIVIVFRWSEKCAAAVLH